MTPLPFPLLSALSFVRLAPACVAVFMAACGNLPSLPDLGLPSNFTIPNPLPPPGAGLPPDDPPGPGAEPVPSVQRITPPFALTPEEVKAMLIRSDPKACSATADASATEMATIYAKIGFTFGSRLVVSRVTEDAELQHTLDEFRPYLREVSRNTTWMPVPAERLVGDELYKRNRLQPYTPPARHKVLLDQTITPIFKELARFAREDLKSPVQFDLRVVRDDTGTSPSAIAGGIIIIPSGMFSAMGRVKQPEQVIAFMLAHEFSHVLRRHKTKMVQMSLVDSMTMAGEYRKLATDFKSGLPVMRRPDQIFSFSTGNVASLMDQTCKSRNWLPSMEQDQEFEADVCGSLLLDKLAASRRTNYNALAGYEQYLAAGLAAQVPSEQAGLCPVKTSHPQPARRKDNLAAYSARSGKGR